MRRKIRSAIIKVSVFTLLASFILVSAMLYHDFTEKELIDQQEDLIFIARGVTLNGMDYLNTLGYVGSRITLIGDDGTVLYDNRVAVDTMENHGQREEVLEAKKTGWGQSERHSDTLSKKTLYTAIRLTDGSVLRLSVTQMSAFSMMANLLYAVVIILFAGVVIAIGSARRIANRIVEPWNDLDLDKPLDNTTDEELVPLLLRIDEQNHKIQGQLRQLDQRNEAIVYLTERVSDGIIALDDRGVILSANRQAKALLSCAEGEFYLQSFRDLQYKAAVERALNGKSGVCTVKIREKSYRISASTAGERTERFSVFLFISDITEEENALEMRRQFTANVSHELKTPLASIMGSAEIMANGIAKQEDVPHFSRKIYDESVRLLKLIQDIIKISHLDEGKLKEEFTAVPLNGLCHTVAQELAQHAQEVQVVLDVHCDESVILGYEPVLHEMLYNLCDNGLAYNRPGGSVTLTVAGDDKWVTVAVKDTGIGIAQEHLNRVFERFYRVDKSRSKLSGGTGLGLSIVKHGAMLHQAELFIDSQVGQGTTIQIKFPTKV